MVIKSTNMMRTHFLITKNHQDTKIIEGLPDTFALLQRANSLYTREPLGIIELRDISSENC